MSKTATRPRAAIASIGTSVPRFAYTQEQALAFMKAVPSYNDDDRAFLDRIYPPSAIATRYSAIGDFFRDPAEYEFFSRSPDLLPEPPLEKRNNIYNETAPIVAGQAAAEAISSAGGIATNEITHIITVSCTGFAAPGIDIAVQRELGLPANTRRVHIGFMGCYAAIPALRTAMTTIATDPNAVVLVVAVELCSLHFQLKPDREQMVANSLFADGAAAVLLTSPERTPDGIFLHDFESALLDDSDRDMAWTIGSVAFDMRLSAYVPKIVQRNITPVVRTLLDRNDLAIEDVARWSIHPGGRAVLERVCRGLQFEPEGIEDSYRVLEEFGNMSSPTILFVLKRAVERLRTGQDGAQRVRRHKGHPTRRYIFAAAFGPGLTVESTLLSVG